MKDLIEQYGKGLVIKKDELTAIERTKLFDEGKPITVSRAVWIPEKRWHRCWDFPSMITIIRPS